MAEKHNMTKIRERRRQALEDAGLLGEHVSGSQRQFMERLL